MRQANGGWIKIWRSLLDHPIVTQMPHSYLTVWVLLLINARREPSSYFNHDSGVEVPLPSGSLLLGTEEFAEACRVSRSALRRVLEYLVQSQMITRISTTRGTIVTICNWTTYQSDEEDGGQRAANERPTSGQRAATVKELRIKKEEVITHRASGDARVRRTHSSLTEQQAVWFADWYQGYWRKVARDDGEAAFAKHVQTEEMFRAVMEATRLQAPEMLGRPTGKRPHPASWLNGRRWNDAIAEPSQPSLFNGKPSFTEGVKQLALEKLEKYGHL